MEEVAVYGGSLLVYIIADSRHACKFFGVRRTTADGTTTMDICCHDSNEFDASDRKKIEEGLRGLGFRNG